MSEKAKSSQPQTIDHFLNAIKQKESKNNYEAQHPKSGGIIGTGAYGFIDTTWKRLGGNSNTAKEATKEKQDEIAKKYANDLWIKYQGDVEKMAQAWNYSDTLVDMKQVPPDGIDYGKDIVKRMETDTTESKSHHKASETRYRFHNPGNLKAGESWKGLAGIESTPRGDFCRFETEIDGLRAMATMIYRCGRDGINTVKSLIKVYHPDLEEAKVEEYAKFVETKMKLERDGEINLTDPLILQRIMPIMIEYETNQEPPSQEEIGKSIQGIESTEKL